MYQVEYLNRFENNFKKLDETIKIIILKWVNNCEKFGIKFFQEGKLYDEKNFINNFSFSDASINEWSNYFCY